MIEPASPEVIYVPVYYPTAVYRGWGYPWWYYPSLYVGPPPHSALQIGSRENLIAIHSLSKRSGMTGYRSGFIAGDPALIATLREARANFGVASQGFVQAAAIAAWNDDAHVEERRKVFADKRAVLLAHLRKLGLAVGGDGAFYLWVRVPPGFAGVR